MKMEEKMVDFAIYIQPDPRNEIGIRTILCSDNKDAQYVKRTMFGRLRMRLIVINVETKMPFSGRRDRGCLVRYLYCSRA